MITEHLNHEKKYDIKIKNMEEQEKTHKTRDRYSNACLYIFLIGCNWVKQQSTLSMLAIDIFE